MDSRIETVKADSSGYLSSGCYLTNQKTLLNGFSGPTYRLTSRNDIGIRNGELGPVIQLRSSYRARPGIHRAVVTRLIRKHGVMDSGSQAGMTSLLN